MRQETKQKQEAKTQWERQWQHEKDLQRIRDFRLMDDDFLSKCFEDNIECTELVLKIILNQKELKVQQVRTQATIKNLQGRSIRMDILATDRDGRQINIEVQRSDRGAIAKRARYNSSLMDANLTEPGEEYNALPETYVIFITEKDVLKKNLPIYHVDRMVRETGDDFQDEAHIIYVNGQYQDDSPLGILMKDFFCTDPDDMYYKPLAERARYLKQEKEGVANMCRAMEEMREEAAARAVAYTLIGNIETLSKSVGSIEKACEMLGHTVDDYEAATKLVGWLD